MELPAECAVVVYTDGVVERPGRPLDETIDELAATLVPLLDTDADTLLAASLASASRRDDCVCVIARRTRMPPTGSEHDGEQDRSPAPAVREHGAP
jgi:hypothetical protein